MCGTVCGVGTNALGSSYALLGLPWTAGVPVEAGEIQIVPVNTALIKQHVSGEIRYLFVPPHYG